MGRYNGQDENLVQVEQVSKTIVNKSSDVTILVAFSPMNLVWMLLFILLVATVASVGPAWRAARVKIAQTLRYE